MKAWIVDSGDPWEGVLLVYAETRNQARYLATMSIWEWPYEVARARRAPGWDRYYRGNNIIEMNIDLPKHAPAFYTDKMEYA